MDKQPTKDLSGGEEDPDIIRLEPSGTSDFAIEFPFRKLSLPAPKMSDSASLPRGVPIGVVRRAVRELETDSIDALTRFRLGVGGTDSSEFRKRFIEMRCEDFLKSSNNRKKASDFVYLYGPDLVEQSVGAHSANDSPTPPRDSDRSHSLVLSKNPWAVYSLKDLFRHQGPLLTLTVGALIFCGYQIALSLGSEVSPIAIVALIAMLLLFTYVPILRMYGNHNQEFGLVLVKMLLFLGFVGAVFFIVNQYSSAVSGYFKRVW